MKVPVNKLKAVLQLKTLFPNHVFVVSRNKMADTALAERCGKLDRFYTTVFAQCFSPCGKYLAAGNNFGKIAIFGVSNYMNPDGATIILNESRKPIYVFQGHQGPIYSLVSTENFLISAGHGDIMGWAWSDIAKKTGKVSWTLTVPKGDGYDKPEINAVATRQKHGITTLYAGCGDSQVHIYDLETGKLTSKLSGHKDYVHCVAVTNNGNECWTGAEDGQVILWDVRKGGSIIHTIEPYKQEMCARPNLGKWIGCLALDGGDDWMVCGGGPALSLWHLRSWSCTSVFTPAAATHCAAFHEDLILSGGSEADIHKWSYNGDLRSKVPSSSTSIYSLAFSESSNQKQILAAAGSSPYIDICTNLKYRDFTLVFS